MKTKDIWIIVSIIIIGFMLMNCATTGGEIEIYQEVDYLPKPDVGAVRMKNNSKWVVNTMLGWTDDSLYINSGGYVAEILKYNKEQYPALKDQIESGKVYTVYVTVIKEGGLALLGTEVLFYHVDRIEGLEEPGVIAARKQEEEVTRRKAYWSKANPDNHDLLQYERTTSSDFSFDMIAGNLSVGAKVGFSATFFIKPTGTSYKFDDVDLSLTLHSQHNFVRELSNSNFEPIPIVNQKASVFVYVTVLRSGQFGECSIDALHWDAEFNKTWGKF